MLIVLFIIGMILLVTGSIIYNATAYAWLGLFMGWIGGIIACVSFLVIIGCSVDLSNRMIIDERIALYQTENQNIETQISTTVESYKEYEQETFKNLKSDSVITLVALFPELKADEVVKKQIDLYIANNQKIKELKETKLGYRPLAWWLYFGK